MKGSEHRAARDISYAASAASPFGRAMIRLLENSTGRLNLVRRANGYHHDVDGGNNFFEVMAARYGLSLELIGGSLDLVPRKGPVIFVANHPYGILDGLVLGLVLSRTRDDFRILANSVFTRSADLERYLLPINFDTDRAARVRNLDTRREALAYLNGGGAIGLFPGGTVSTGAGVFSKPMDPCWRSFTARMIAKSRAMVVPIYFDGQTSRMFQIASHLNMALRLGLLIREFRKRVDMPVRVAVGAPINRDALDPLSGDAKAMMDFLRKATYELSTEPLETSQLGFEFDHNYRT